MTLMTAHKGDRTIVLGVLVVVDRHWSVAGVLGGELCVMIVKET